MASLLHRNFHFYKQLRNLNRSCNMASKVNVVPTFNMNAEKKAFIDVLPEVINSVVTSPKVSELPELGNWLKKLLQYILCDGKLGRGLMISIGYKMFEDPNYYSEKTQHSARVLGWCIEMTSFLILDDIADDAKIRRGKPCWHRYQKHLNVGLSAVNDSLLMRQSMLDILDIYFGQTPYFADLIRYFNEASYRASMGEHLDIYSNYIKEENNLDIFNMDRVNAIAYNKSGFYSFKLPIFVPLLLVRNGKEKATEELDRICTEFGRLMQCQDDYMDAYGNELVTGKTRRDIQGGKCTWVSVTALQHCNEVQRDVFRENYGSKDPEHIKRIKRLYDELHIPQLYDQFERTMYDDIMTRIRALSAERDRTFLLEVLKANYKRVN